MGTKKSFDYIANKATKTTPSWTNQQVAQFNYFNPNGLITKFNKMTDTIRDYVDAGIVPSGWHIAYGSFNDFYADLVKEAAMSDKRLNSIALQVHLQGLAGDVDKGYNRLGEMIMGE